jgi:hypothetical protein
VHFKNLCKNPQKRQEVKEEASIASTSGGGDALICSLESKEESWVLDSGASFMQLRRKISSRIMSLETSVKFTLVMNNLVTLWEKVW